MQPYVLSLLHFNLQYCAGGLEGLFSVDWPSDEVSVEDQIIVESFEPVLGLLEAHPDWQMDLELQAYMVEVLALRHPDTLDRLRVLAHAGQVELVSFHYSDQLWTAFPPRDQEASLALVAEIFRAYDLPLSPVVFTQEGQFGPGMLSRMPAFGYTIAVLPHNLGEYAWGTGVAPMYDAGGGVTVLAGGTGGTGDGWELRWHFLNDGELYATNNMNCYLGPAFLADPEALAAREAELEAQVADGAKIVSIGSFVAAVDPPVTPLPPLPDGTWQPDDTDNLWRWMGGAGLWGADESDNGVRTTNMAARHVVAAAEQVPGVDAAGLRDAWKEVLLAEVSDATGWNPYPTEVAYALDHSEAAVAAAVEAIRAPCTDARATGVVVDLTTGDLDWDGALPDAGGTATDPALVLGFGDRVPTETWTRLADDLVAVDLDFGADPGPAEVVFPWDAAEIVTIPAMVETPLHLGPADVVADPLGIALPTGLLRLSEGRWLLEDTRVTHLAALLSWSAGTIRFRDDTAADTSTRWRFLIFDGSEADAVALALATNVYPAVALDCPAGTEVAPPAEGCGCAGLPGQALLVPVGGFIASWLRRRRGGAATERSG